jgi:hypothetical protein
MPWEKRFVCEKGRTPNSHLHCLNSRLKYPIHAEIRLIEEIHGLSKYILETVTSR